MNFKELKKQIKEQQKQLAINIKRGKFLQSPKNWHLMTDQERKTYIYKVHRSGYSSITDGFMNWKVDQLSVEYRHIHIAYCTFFNNTPYDKIEKPAKDNRPHTSRLDLIKKSWMKLLDEETLRNCA